MPDRASRPAIAAPIPSTEGSKSDVCVRGSARSAKGGTSASRPEPYGKIRSHLRHWEGRFVERLAAKARTMNLHLYGGQIRLAFGWVPRLAISAGGLRTTAGDSAHGQETLCPSCLPGGMCLDT